MRLGLHIGTNYPGTSAQLAGCVNDAGDWRNLTYDLGFDDSVLLLDGKVTRDNVLDAINSRVARLGSGDLLVVTYSGHGSWIPDVSGDEPDKRDEVLVMNDFQYIVDDELYVAYEKRKRGARVVFVSDSCHSGSVARFAPSIDPRRGKLRFLAPEVLLEDQPKALALAESIELRDVKVQGKSRRSSVLLSGCADTEYSYDVYFGNRPNGAFSRFAIDTFRELAPKNYIDWYAAIRQHLPSEDLGQTPQLSGDKYMLEWPALAQGR